MDRSEAGLAVRELPEPRAGGGLRWDWAVVAAVSFCLLMIGLGNMAVPFADEHYYLDAAKNFNAGLPSTNREHPPLAKYILALSMKVLGDRPIGWRLPSVFAGTLMAVAIFGVTRKLGGERCTAYIAWLLTVAGGFWYMLGRLAMLSIYEMAFEMAAIWVFLMAMESDSTASWAGAGLLFGLSVASRWFGAMGLLACLGFAFYQRRFLRPCLMGAVAFITYCVSWIPLMLREHRPLGYFITANLTILRLHRGQTPWDTGEPWWTWFFRTEQTRTFSPFLANPVIGVLGLVALVAIVSVRSKRKFVLLAVLYCLDVLPWVLGAKSSTYYHYYFEAYSVLPVALATVTEDLFVRKVQVAAVITAAAFLYFVYWYPTWGFFPPPFGGVFGYH
jgi:dolichyl-phosphate-mannose-protein mannosyltransferase